MPEPQQQYQNMQSVTVEVSKLIGALKENRQKHVDAYQEAVKDYQAALITYYDRQAAGYQEVADRVRRVEEPDVEAIEAACRGQDAWHQSHPSEPVNHEKTYTRAIRMLEMTSETHKVLSEQEFAQYVLDDWKWKQDFLRATASYKSFK